jgi:hypothetical protein
LTELHHLAEWWGVLVKYKNKDGISLSYTGSDVQARLVKEVIGEAIIMLEDYKVADVVDFLKENFDLKTIEDYIDE